MRTVLPYLDSGEIGYLSLILDLRNDLYVFVETYICYLLEELMFNLEDACCVSHSYGDSYRFLLSS